MWHKIGDGFSNVGNWFRDLFTKLGNWFGDIGGWFADLGADIGGWFSDLGEDLGGWFAGIGKGISDLWDTVKNIPQAIGDKLEELFVPSSDWSGATSLMDTLKSKLPWIFETKDAANEFTQSSTAEERLSITYKGVNMVPYETLDKSYSTWFGSYSLIGLIKWMVRIGAWTWFFGWLMGTFRPKPTIS